PDGPPDRAPGAGDGAGAGAADGEHHPLPQRQGDRRRLAAIVPAAPARRRRAVARRDAPAPRARRAVVFICHRSAGDVGVREAAAPAGRAASAGSEADCVVSTWIPPKSIAARRVVAAPEQKQEKGRKEEIYFSFPGSRRLRRRRGVEIWMDQPAEAMLQ